MHNSRRLVKGKPRCTLLIHPADAAARGLADGAAAVVSSRTGEVQLPVEVTDDDDARRREHAARLGPSPRRASAGASASAHAGVSVNDVTDEQYVDRLSGTAAFNGVPVKVSAAPGHSVSGQSITGDISIIGSRCNTTGAVTGQIAGASVTSANAKARMRPSVTAADRPQASAI